MQYNINYIFRLVDNFSGGAVGMAAAMGRVSAASKAMGAALGGAVAIGGAATMFVGAVGAAREWEKEMANVRRLANLSRKDMVAYGQDVLDLSVKYGAGVPEVAQTMSRLAGIGIRGKEVLKTMTDISMLAASGWDGATPEQTSATLGKFADVWFKDKGPEEMIGRVRQLSDAINELGDNSNFKEGQLLKYLDRTSPIMQSLGFTPEQATAFGGVALSTGVESGQMQGTRAEMTMRALMKAGSRPTGNAKWGLKQIGLTKDSWADMVRSSPQGAFLHMLEEVQKFDKIGKQGVINSIVGSKSGAQFVAVAENLNEYKRQLAMVDDQYAKIFSKDPQFMEWLKKSGRFNELAQDLEKHGRNTQREGSLERGQKVRTDTLDFAIKQLGASWNKLQATMGESSLGPLAGAARGVTDALENVTGRIRSDPAMGTTVGWGIATAIMVGLGAGLSAAMSGGAGGIGARILAGLTVGALTMTVGIALVGAGAMIFANWDAFVAKVTQPLNIDINWPELPAPLQWLWQNVAKLSSMRDGVLNEDAARHRADTAFEGGYGPTFGLSPGTDSAVAAADAAAAAYARNAVQNPFMQFQGGASPLADPTMFQRYIQGMDRNADADKLNWNGRDTINGANLAASIPQAVNVTTDVKIQNGTMSGHFTLDASGMAKPVAASAPIVGEASRGSASGGTGSGLTSPNPSNM